MKKREEESQDKKKGIRGMSRQRDRFPTFHDRFHLLQNSVMPNSSVEDTSIMMHLITSRK